MQILSEVQFNHNVSISKHPIWVAEIMFTNGVAVEGVNDFYFASDAIDLLSDGTIKLLPATNKWFPYLDPLSISSISQKVDAMTGVSSIGNLSFKLVDVGGKVSEMIRAADSYADAGAGNIGYGLNRQFIDLYVIYAGDNWDERRKVRRMQVSSVSLDNGTYQFNCEDIQRAARTKVFIPTTGALLTDMTNATTAISIGNTEIGAFPLIVGMSHIKIGDEVMEVTARTELSQQIDLTVVRARANTIAVTHALNDDVSEVVKLSGDPLDIALQVLTGQAGSQSGSYQWDLVDRYNYSVFWGATGGTSTMYRDVPAGDPVPLTPVISGTLITYIGVQSNLYTKTYLATVLSFILPSHWHCGMDIFIHIDDAEWNAVRVAANTPASPFEFWLNKGEDGKLFVEREIMQVLGLFMRVKGDGRIGLKAYNDIADADLGQGVGLDAKSNGDYRNLVIDEEVLVSFTKVDVLRKGDLMTAMSLEYDYLPKIAGKPRRTGNFVDQDGLKKHGEGRTFTMKSRGIIAQNTDALNAIYSRVSRVLARFSRPPMRVQVTCLPKMSPLDIGDVVRVKLPQTDPFTGQDINRRFEILSSSISPKNGTVTFDLVAQPEKASITNFRKTSGYLDSAFLNGSTGTALTAADLAATKDFPAGDYYYVGDATISGNWTIHGTVRFFCSGTMTVTGTINGKGNGETYNGYASAGSAGHDGWFKTVFEEGYFSYTNLTCKRRGGVESRADIRNGGTGGTIDGMPTDVIPAAYDATGKVTQISGVDIRLDGGMGGYGALGISNATTGKLYKAIIWAIENALSSDPITSPQPLPPLYGGTAGIGGAGLELVARRVVLEVGSSVDLSGADGVLPASISSGRIEYEVLGCNDFYTHTFQPGKGGGGGGGSLRCIAESGIAGGIFINQQPNLAGGDTAAGAGKIEEVLL